MSKAIGWKNRFNSGELADEVWSNSDLQQHANGCAVAYNAMPRAQGPLAKRYGTWFAGLCMDQDAATWAVPFVRSVDDAWMIELGDGFGRVRDALGAPLMSGMSPLQFASPYASADLPGLRWTQTGDVIVFFHADGRQPQRLLRDATGGWSFAAYVFENGPWRTENSNRALTIEASGINGVVTLTASGALFVPQMVGVDFRLRTPEGSIGINTWAPDIDPLDHEMFLFGGRAYYSVSSGSQKTGLTPPIHEQGTVSDGNMPQTFLHDGAGIVRITAYVSPTQATATVIQTLPYQAKEYTAGANPAFPPTSTWAEAAYSDYRGWPTAWPAVREDRLIVGGGRSEADKFDATRTAGYDTAKADFKPGLGTGRVVADDAVRKFCGTKSSKLAWLCSASQLLAGTHADENVIAGATLDEPLTPDGTKVRPLTGYGSADGPAPEQAHDAVLYVARGGVTLREMVVGGDLSLAGGDLSFFAEHIAGRGMAQLCWTGEPDNLLWTRLEDGGLAAFLYHREQKAFGWASQGLGSMSVDDPGWTVECAARLPGAFGRTALWLHVVREKSPGVFQRMILIQSARAERLRLDAAERYAGAATTGVVGLDHLEGERVTLMTRDAQGRWAQYRDILVTGGAAVLPGGRTATEIYAGLPYLFRFESLPTDLEGPGTTQGQRTRVSQMLVIAKGVSGAARAGTITDGEDPSPLDAFGVRATGETSGVVPKRLAERVTCTAGASRDGRLVVEDDSGFDFTLHALRPVGWVNA